MSVEHEIVSRAQLNTLIESLLDLYTENNGEAPILVSEEKEEIKVLTKSSRESEPMAIVPESSNMKLLSADVTSTSPMIEDENIVMTKPGNTTSLDVDNNILEPNRIYRLKTFPHNVESCSLIAPFFVFRKATEENHRELVHLYSFKKHNISRARFTPHLRPIFSLDSMHEEKTVSEIQSPHEENKDEIGSAEELHPLVFKPITVTQTDLKLKNSLTLNYDEKVTLPASALSNNNSKNNPVDL